MEVICRNVSKLESDSRVRKAEKKYQFAFPESVIDFFVNNNGGNPIKKEFAVNNTVYEIRCFLSFQDGDYNEIYTALESFQKETNGKILPLAKDSGDSYYCLNVETENIYYWDKEENLYYKLADTFEEFIGYLM